MGCVAGVDASSCGMSRTLFCLPLLAGMSVSGVLPCDARSQDPPPQTGSGDPWTTEPEFEFGEWFGDSTDTNFALVSTVRVLAGGNRVVVAEPQIFRATIWTPDGSLIAEIGRSGEGPGEFSGGLGIRVHRRGFHVVDAQRFTSFSNDGMLVRTIPFPPRSLGFRGFGLGPEVLLDDGSVLAVPRVSPAAMIGLEGADPIRRVPVFRLREADREWRMDRIAVLDLRNRNLTIIPEGSSMYEGGINSAQPFGDYDLTWFDPTVGSVVVVRRNLGGGEVELVEIIANGDTAWRRRLAPSPVRMTPRQVKDYIDRTARELVERISPGVPYRAMRAAVQEALHLPDPLPGARRAFGTQSGEIWFRGSENEDSLRVWYAVPRGEGQSRVRRVALPPGFRVTDATNAHVWGVRTDELGVNYVVGRRLVPPLER